MGDGPTMTHDATSGAFIDAFLPIGALGVSDAPLFALGPDGNVYVTANNQQQVVWRFNPDVTKTQAVHAST